ncbi:hypothetical protein K466DRAFT_504286 [Polyporus arcularius HHB13444]|uniref:Uncharacterized protein n=1 Tax=Polyporus arcularius HHB13444 TaxID=1314778 RepID=A0A5C3NW30_9APHY|nr:hypothetical protein K466DRAFT_504286 [Polyporus arcularius HHB13444]
MVVVREPSRESFSVVQTKIASNLDRFLPFREHGLSRRKVQGVGGAFHPAIMDLPGGFASCVLTRTHLFNSRLLLELRSSSHYRSLAEWKQTLLDHGFQEPSPDDKEQKTAIASLTPILNMSSYGQPQCRRFKAVLKDPVKYFQQEQQFRDLWARVQATNTDDPELKKIPFLRFLKWTQSTVNSQKVFPMLGNLTGYLLSADFVYAGRVARPSVEEIGRVIARMGLGSLRGLIALGHPLTMDSSAEQVADAFKYVHDELEKAFTAEEREWMMFDPIMVEHTLCKYNRVLGPGGGSD